MDKYTVGIFMVVVFVALTGLDLYLSNDRRTDNTFSARFRALGRIWPPARLLITLALGLVLGHLFWTPQDVHDAGGAQICPPSADAAP